VVQKVLNSLKEQETSSDFIYDEIIQQFYDVATHKHGCCVLQRCIDHSSDNQLKKLANEIVENSIDLVQDQYGNYVVQYLLEQRGINSEKVKISKRLAENFVVLSK